jgi:hypothetical protein
MVDVSFGNMLSSIIGVLFRFEIRFTYLTWSADDYAKPKFIMTASLTQLWISSITISKSTNSPIKKNKKK